MEKVTEIKKKRAAAPRRRRRTAVLAVGGALVLAFVALSVYFSLYVDWLWFGEVGLRQVFWTQFWWRIITGLAAGGLFFVIVYANVLIARRLSPTYRVFEGVDVVEFVNEKASRIARRAGLAVSLVIAVIVGLGASSEWLMVQRALHAARWGTSDPVFGHDYSFYVFKLPLWHGLYSLVLGALITSLVVAVALHAALGGLVVQRKRRAAAGDVDGAAPSDVRRAMTLPDFDLEPKGAVVAHISALLGAVFLTGAAGSLFRAWELLYSSAGVVAGAGYADVHARLPGARVPLVAALAIAAMLFTNVWRRRWRWPLYAVVGWIVVLVLVRGVWPGVVQWLIVNPNQQEKEQQYIAYNLEATRDALNLDRIDQSEYALKGDLTTRKLQDNEVTLRNIRLWDPRTLLTSYRQLQELRPYYNFVDVDVDRYTVDGVYRQTMLSARELDVDRLPDDAQTWVNRHITYTHGFGAAVSAVNQVTPDGSPDFLVKDIPPVAHGDLRIDQPRIYYGELGADYRLVRTSAPEFDYPGAGGEDVFSEYDGEGGIGIGSTWRRLAFSLRFGTIKFLTTTYIRPDSRVLIRTDIKERLAAAAPFLTFDHDPYMVIAGGRLYWVADAYTTTDRYPYGQPQGDLNYIRNSVKAVVDAYDGTVRFYVFDEQDPVLATYREIFPDMFLPRDEVPAELVAHVRYPEDYFNVQAEAFATYHVTDPDVLYNKGDQWQIPDNVSLEGGGAMNAYYVIMRPAGQESEEFLLMLPFVPNGKQNMIAWLGAFCDVPDYGDAVSFGFPDSLQVYGPSQVEGVINQDTDISQQFTLWGQQGSDVIMGNLLIIPIEDSLLYVQPVYLQSAQTPLPQLKRVIVFYRATTPAGKAVLGGDDQRVVMKATLGESLAAIFGSAPAAAGPAGEEPPGDEPGGDQTGPSAASAEVRRLIERANSEFDAAQEALKSGDWAEYGRRVDALEQTLTELQRAR